MLIKSPALILGLLKYNERTSIVHLFTEVIGSVSLLTPAPKAQHFGRKTALLQPLNQVVVEWNHNEKHGLSYLRNINCTYTYTSLHNDFYKVAIKSFLCEFLYYALRNERQGNPLFAYICSSLQWLDTANMQYSNFHIVLQIRIAQFLGILPNLRKCPTKNFFDFRNGCYTTLQPLHNEYLRGPEAFFVRSLTKINIYNMSHFKFTSSQRTKILETINNYYRIHIPSFPQLKSIEILREVFS